MRRLFSTFAHGAPGVGLLIMRAAAGMSLIIHAVATLILGPELPYAASHVLVAGVGVLLLLGLWTPVAATLTVLDAAWHAFSNPGDAGFYILLGIIAAALVLLGPGAWSIDARLFGWRRVEIPNRKKHDPPPF